MTCDDTFEWFYRGENTDLIAMKDEYEIADLINARSLNILIDLTGLSGSHATPVLAQHPAPISLTWLEYPGTLGDRIGVTGIVTDKIASPAEMIRAYAERLVRVS